MQSPLPPYNVSQPVSQTVPANERTMALLSHLSIWLPQIGLILPLILWLANRETAPFAAYQAKQAFFFHLAVTVMFWIVAAGGVILSILTIGLFLFVLIPVLGAWHLAAAIYGTIAALKAYEGRDFRYAVIGDMIQPD